MIFISVVEFRYYVVICITSEFWTKAVEIDQLSVDL